MLRIKVHILCQVVAKILTFKYFDLLSEFDSSEAPSECSKWEKDGFKCVEKDNCIDDHFYSSRGVVAIRGAGDLVDISKVGHFK